MSISEKNSCQKKTKFDRLGYDEILLSGQIELNSIVNGPGLRAVLWTQGCWRHCEGCQNPETWGFDCGVVVKIPDLLEELRKIKNHDGLTFCGGEPFLQADKCRQIAKFCRQELGWNCWAFSGYRYEEIMEDEKMRGFLLELDGLFDGPFILSQRDLSVKFRGSRNQRMLYLKDGKVVNEE